MGKRAAQRRRVVHGCRKVLVRVWAYGPLSLDDLVDDLEWHHSSVLYYCWLLVQCGMLRRRNYRNPIKGRGRRRNGTRWHATPKTDALLDREPLTSRASNR